MSLLTGTAQQACLIQVEGIVQGVGFRPHVFRLANRHGLRGWVKNGHDGVRIHVEGGADAVTAFVSDLRDHPPPAARIASVRVEPDTWASCAGFEIRDSDATGRPTTRIAPDLPVCDDCLREMRAGGDRRARYPYINCTNCGPRFTIVRALPYDRCHTTMAGWPLCEACANDYHDPNDRRFHAQPVACPQCGPRYRLVTAADARIKGPDVVSGDEAVRQAVRLLAEGRILAVKGIGGFHLVCDADREAAVTALRERKFRKDKAFAVMVRDLATAERTAWLTPASRALLASIARPIVLVPSRVDLPGVAPDNSDVGLMLPYAPLHHLLFDAGAPDRLVMTSGNRSSEPIAYEDADALARLPGLADAFLIGERPIARRVDDSIVRDDVDGPVVLRRSRGLAPGAVALLPSHRPILALGGDLKNAITLVVDGQAYVSQHIGDLSDRESARAFEETVRDLLTMYDVDETELTVVHDRHPEYASTSFASSLTGAGRIVGVQHHRAHVASVLAEHQAWDRRVVGVALDGTGYGDDGTIWGGEFFVGSVRDGFERVAHLRGALLPGGDSAARHPVQAAAGFLESIEPLPDLTEPPFNFPGRYRQASALIRSGLRTFPTTSAGRLFDTVAALTGFVRPITFEGQAAMWLEHLARGADGEGLLFPLPLVAGELDWFEMLRAIVAARLDGIAPAVIARSFHASLAHGIASAAIALAEEARVDTVVLSGGVFQNAMLVDDVRSWLKRSGLTAWINHEVPPNDGGLSLGQAALALALIAER